MEETGGAGHQVVVKEPKGVKSASSTTSTTSPGRWKMARAAFKAFNVIVIEPGWPLAKSYTGEETEAGNME